MGASMYRLLRCGTPGLRVSAICCAEFSGPPGIGLVEAGATRASLSTVRLLTPCPYATDFEARETFSLVDAGATRASLSTRCVCAHPACEQRGQTRRAFSRFGKSMSLLLFQRSEARAPGEMWSHK